LILEIAGACGSSLSRAKVFSSVALTLHILAKDKKKRCFGVKPSIKMLSLACFVRKNAS
jgi:hypothetical protein